MGLIKQAMAEMEADRDVQAMNEYIDGLIFAGEVPEGTKSLDGLRRGYPNEELYYTDCTRCANPIPPCELVEALDNGGLCNYCHHMTDKD